MIYLDTSALIKLYFIEEGSQELNELIMAQDEPLPIWELQEAEFVNALRLKVFWGELADEQADRQIEIFQERKRGGFYYFPELGRTQLLPKFYQFCRHTQKLGCRTLDVLHVVCASLIEADQFVSYDTRQCQLAEEVELAVLSP